MKKLNLLQWSVIVMFTYILFTIFNRDEVITYSSVNGSSYIYHNLTTQTVIYVHEPSNTYLEETYTYDNEAEEVINSFMEYDYMEIQK